VSQHSTARYAPPPRKGPRLDHLYNNKQLKNTTYLTHNPGVWECLMDLTER